ncbi:MAG TPA: hypothetical protein P5096_03080 [Patescibacteria group bacterium]|nr:hypothetical protein [Patescibacteria group bacterium]
METENNLQEDDDVEDKPENYDVPNIEGEIDTVDEEIEFLEKKKKIPVWIWAFLIIVVSFIAFYLASNQNPALIISQ